MFGQTIRAIIVDENLVFFKFDKKVKMTIQSLKWPYGAEMAIWG